MPGGKKQQFATNRHRRCVTTDNATLEDQCHPRKIFIGGLASDTATQDLREYFGRYGSIVDAVVLRWPDGRSRGFGYVTFAEAHSSAAVLKTTHTLGGQEVDVRRAVPGTNKLFVGGLPQNTMAAELREHFEAYGVVSDAVVMIDPATGRSRGFGFVCFAPGSEGAGAVAAALEQYGSHRIRGKWVEVKSAAPPHKFSPQEMAEASAWTQPGFSPAGTPPPCPTPPPLPEYTLLGAPGAQVEEDGEQPLPKLLGPAGWAEPQKVPLPYGAAAAIGAPPGLDAFAPPSPGQLPYRSQRGVPRPGALAAAAAAANQQHMWWPAGHRMPVPAAAAYHGGLGGGAVGQELAAAPQSDLGSALQKSLEELLRLKAHGGGVGAPGALATA